jgi:hypothetical protein
MKRLIFTALIGAAATGVFAQDSNKAVSDTAKHKKGEYNFSFGLKKNNSDSTAKRRSKAPGFSMGLTFSRFDLGLTALIDNGSTKLSPQNEFLRYRSWKTSNVGFDVIQAGYRFNPTFKIYVAGGFDWELIRLREDITIQRDPDMSGLKYTKDPIDYDKNRFSSAYLRIPVMFDFRSQDNANGKKWHYVFGPELGVLLTGRVKQISDENGKQKMNYDYHFTKFRYGAVARIGHGSLGLFAKYYFNDMFNTTAQKGLKNASVGFTVGF